MRIYFVRHADAEQGDDDASRKLTAKGVIQSEKIGKFLKLNDISFDAIYSSPLVRAVQTGEIIASVISPEKKPEVLQTPVLLNDATQEQFDAFTRSILSKGNVMLIGHAPSIDDRVIRLLGISKNCSLKMPKASVVCIETDDGINGVLKFFISHKYL